MPTRDRLFPDGAGLIANDHWRRPAAIASSLPVWEEKKWYRQRKIEVPLSNYKASLRAEWTNFSGRTATSRGGGET